MAADDRPYHDTIDGEDILTPATSRVMYETCCESLQAVVLNGECKMCCLTKPIGKRPIVLVPAAIQRDQGE